MQIRGAQVRLIFAKDQIATDQHLVELVQQRKDAGIASNRPAGASPLLLLQAPADRGTSLACRQNSGGSGETRFTASAMINATP
jgi:hypothetical protein